MRNLSLALVVVITSTAAFAEGQQPASVVEKQQKAAEQRWMEDWLRGPTRTRWTQVPVQVGDVAPDLEVKDSTGKTRRLSELWKDGPVFLVFMRMFGCSCLAGRWERLQAELPAYEKAGMKVVAVGQAEPERTADVARRRGYPFPVLADPERKVYQAFGLLEGTPAQILHDFNWKPGDRATGQKLIDSRRGTEKALGDSPWQLPGEFVIGRDGRILLAHRYQYCEDYPDKTVVLGALAAASAPMKGEKKK